MGCIHFNTGSFKVNCPEKFKTMYFSSLPNLLFQFPWRNWPKFSLICKAVKRKNPFSCPSNWKKNRIFQMIFLIGLTGKCFFCCLIQLKEQNDTFLCQFLLQRFKVILIWLCVAGQLKVAAGTGRVLAASARALWENTLPWWWAVAESSGEISWKISLCAEFAALLFNFGRNK